MRQQLKSEGACEEPAHCQELASPDGYYLMPDNAAQAKSAEKRRGMERLVGEIRKFAVRKLGVRLSDTPMRLQVQPRVLPLEDRIPFRGAGIHVDGKPAFAVRGPCRVSVARVRFRRFGTSVDVTEWHVDLEKIVTVEELGSYRACPESGKRQIYVPFVDLTDARD
jgi:hypothetical protein